MTRAACLLLFALAWGSLCAATDSDVVFRSDVSLVRVDAQVVDRDNRVITGLNAGDFVLLEEGRPQPIRNFESEAMPLDVLLLLDVSRSMRPNIERISSASHQAFQVLRDQDRLAIMVFDRATRVRMPFRNGRDEAEHELSALLRDESFDGGTDITRGLLDAAEYVGNHARPEVRRAIVIVTDDQTERDRDEAAVSRALTRANAVLCALIAPDAIRYRDRGYPGGGGRSGPRDGPRPGAGGTGGGIGGSLGGIIFGRRGPWGGRGGPSGGGSGPEARRPHTKSEGTAEISRQSGGDSMPVEDASSLETTLSRLRQRYALNFYLPQGVKPGEERDIEVELAASARERYPGAEVHYRRVYYVPDTVAAAQHQAGRRRAVSEPTGPAGPIGSNESSGTEAPTHGGWRRVGPDPQP